MSNIILLIIIFLTAVWVYKDSKKYEKAGLTIADPLAWGLLVFLFWLPFFPIYLTLKYLKYQKQFLNPSYQPNKKLLVLIIIFFIVSSIILAFIFFRK